MTDKKPLPKEEQELTEWQKRHLEFELRKQEREAEKAKQEEQEREQKRLAMEENRDLIEERYSEGAESEANVSEEEVAEPDDSADVLEENETVEATEPVQDEFSGSVTLEKKPDPAPPPKPLKRGRTPFQRSLQLAMPLLLFSIIVMLLSLYTISPLSKDKVFNVVGVTYTDQSTILEASRIKDTDYISHVFLNRSRYEKAIVANDPWVKSARIYYEFPNRFTIRVEEYPIVAYQETAEGYHPVLANGQRGDMVTVSQLPEQFMRIGLVDETDIKQFIRQLMTVDESIRQGILTVNFTGSDSTEDLLALVMSDGHTIRVPLSEIALKLPYYKAIRSRLTVPSIVDMEVGIYATTEYLELQASETKASKEQESREQEALYGTASTSSASTATQTEQSTSSTQTTEQSSRN